MKSNKFILCPENPGEGLGPDSCAPPCGPPPFGGPCPGCPVVTLDENSLLIDDDYGDNIKIDSKDISKLVNDIEDLLS